MTKNRTLEGLSRTGKVNTEVGSGGTVKEDVLIWQDFIAGPKPVKTKKDRKQPAALFRTSREHLARPRPAQVELLTRLTFDPTLITPRHNLDSTLDWARACLSLWEGTVHL